MSQVFAMEVFSELAQSPDQKHSSRGRGRLRVRGAELPLFPCVCALAKLLYGHEWVPGVVNGETKQTPASSPDCAVWTSSASNGRNAESGPTAARA